MVKLRLRRTGTRNKASFRIVAADTRSPRDGRFIEILGFYDPRHEDEKIDLERVDYWLSNGAQPSETVASIIERARKGSGALVAEKKVEKKVTEEKTEAAPAEAEAAAEAAPAEAEAAAEETTTEEAPAEAEAAAEEAPAEEAKEKEVAAE
jgi:small subunit ribosomal protein S16